MLAINSNQETYVIAGVATKLCTSCEFAFSLGVFVIVNSLPLRKLLPISLRLPLGIADDLVEPEVTDEATVGTPRSPTHGEGGSSWNEWVGSL